MSQQIPVIDLHCDLLFYLALIPDASIEKTDEIGVALPHLQQGNIAAQVLAIFTSTEPESTVKAQLQLQTFLELRQSPQFFQPPSLAALDVNGTGPIAIIPAIENASGFCGEDDPLSEGLIRLENMISSLGEVLYISFTHHVENRFGGGNYSNNIGLKMDGKALLEYLDGRKIAMDLSHASDQLALDILDFITRHNLSVPVMASHSNFRSICGHVRNLPDELALEIIHRSGLIGSNFLRAYVDDNHPEKLDEHLSYGMALGAKHSLAFGADFFYTKNFYDPDRYPLYHPDHEHAGVYPILLERWKNVNILQAPQAIAHNNVLEFVRKIYR